jgi:hypothetical protein
MEEGKAQWRWRVAGRWRRGSDGRGNLKPDQLIGRNEKSRVEGLVDGGGGSGATRGAENDGESPVDGGAGPGVCVCVCVCVGGREGGACACSRGCMRAQCIRPLGRVEPRKKSPGVGHTDGGAHPRRGPGAEGAWARCR